MVDTFGWDASHYDSPSLGNAIADGIQFMTHKAGGDADDPEISAWWSNVKAHRVTGADLAAGTAAGKVFAGAYWVQYPGNPTGRADAFLARLDATCPGWRDAPFLLQVDCEAWGGNQGTVPPVADVNAFCDRLVAKMPKLRPIAYMPDWVYGDLSGLRYPLWSSKYVTGQAAYKSLYPGDGSPKWAPYGGKTPLILQYSSTGLISGVSRPGDVNAFRGTLTQLVAALAPGWMTTMEEDMPLTDPEIAKITQSVTQSVVDELTRMKPFPANDTLGGMYSEVGAALSTGYPRLPGNQRTAAWSNLQAMHIDIKAILAALGSLSTAEASSNAAAAAALTDIRAAVDAAAQTVAAQVIAALPQGSDTVSQEEVTTAVREAFAQAFGGQGA